MREFSSNVMAQAPSTVRCSKAGAAAFEPQKTIRIRLPMSVVQRLASVAAWSWVHGARHEAVIGTAGSEAT